MMRHNFRSLTMLVLGLVCGGFAAIGLHHFPL